MDLRGLPPTLEEIDVFTNDDAPDAYERAVDRFLADPAFGERWARVWLDLARYADSSGYGSDPLRTIWRYRDWVIDAYNRNLPYDRFAVEQIAGDLLPNPTLEQKIATAFHRNTMTNTEGGTDDEEFRSAAIKDRVDSTFQVFMGLTAGCAKCHDHKYDPITQKEYYQLYAFFNQTADNDQPDESPVIAAPDRLTLEAAREIEGKILAFRSVLESSTPELVEAQSVWERSLERTSAWSAISAIETSTESGAVLEKLSDQSIRAGGPRLANDAYTLAFKTEIKGVTAIELEAIPDQAYVNGGSGRGVDGNFVLSRISVQTEPAESASAKAPSGRYVRIELPGPDRILSLAEVQVEAEGKNVAIEGVASQSSTDFGGEAKRAIDGDVNGDYEAARSTTHTRQGPDPWWELDLKTPRVIDKIKLWNRTGGGIGDRLAGCRVLILDETRMTVWRTDLPGAPNPNIELETNGRRAVPLARAFADFSQTGFPVGASIGSGEVPTETGWAVAPYWGKPHKAIFVLSSPINQDGDEKVTIKLIHGYKEPYYLLGRFKLSVTNDQGAVLRAEVPDPILAIVDLPVEKRTRQQSNELARHFRSISPLLAGVRGELEKLEKSKPKPPTVPIMVELPPEKRRETRLLVKGSHLNPGETVVAKLPGAFHAGRSEAADRLALARWIVDPQNPLTARVAVNRYWSQLFGVGIVETEEDFGTQGEPPSHPELLDWLALEYVKLGWDTKALLREIVCSSTYRQSSKTNSELLERDPRNRLLARGPRFRLEAEMVRDQALVLSGLMSRKMHGPSVFPPQPEGLWQAAFNGERTWRTSTGEDRHRRGLYTFWRRTVPYPSMAAFDAPSREVCLVRRSRTNTPLQSFVTLNDPAFVECAQALARRIVREGGASERERSRFGLRLCLGRPASEEQIASIVSLYRSEVERYKKDAKAGARACDRAAWTIAGRDGPR